MFGRLVDRFLTESQKEFLFFMGLMRNFRNGVNSLNLLVEPDRAVRCRRFILLSGSAVIFSFLNCVTPSSISFANISVDGLMGDVTVGAAVFLGQIYCWFVRYGEILNNGEWSYFKDGRHVSQKVRLYPRMLQGLARGHFHQGKVDVYKVDGGYQSSVTVLSSWIALLFTVVTFFVVFYWVLLRLT